MRITEARLEDAEEHEYGLRFLHEQSLERISALKAIKSELLSRIEAINKEINQP
jgi:hypothetical protein